MKLRKQMTCVIINTGVGWVVDEGMAPTGDGYCFVWLGRNAHKVMLVFIVVVMDKGISPLSGVHEGEEA